MKTSRDRNVVWYPTKVDRWYWVLVVILVLVMLSAVIASFIEGDRTEIIVACVASALTAGVIAMVSIPVRYGVGERELIVRFGIFRKRVRLDAIREVRPTRSLLSAPALSLDRVGIYTSSRYVPEVLISPADREGFLDALAARAKLRRDGERLVQN